jgi:hypothetical protein
MTLTPYGCGMLYLKVWYVCVSVIVIYLLLYGTVAVKFSNAECASHYVEQHPRERGRRVGVCDLRPAIQYAVKDEYESAVHSQLSSSSCGDLLEHRIRTGISSY